MHWADEKQTIDGFSASGAFHQAGNLSRFPEQTRNEILDHQGIGLRIVRNIIGAGHSGFFIFFSNRLAAYWKKIYHSNKDRKTCIRHYLVLKKCSNRLYQGDSGKYMHTCSYCGIEYDPSEVMCPACGHKTGKTALPEKEKKESDELSIKEEKGGKKEEIKIPVKTPDDSGKKEEKKKAFYEKALLRLEKSLSKKKEKKEPATPGKSRSKEPVSFLLKFFYFSRISYIIWFFIGFTGLTFASGYTFAGWFEKIFTLLFTSNIQAEAELLNVHHRFNNLIPSGFPPGSFFILNADVLLLVPVLSCIIPLVLWLVKNKSAGVPAAGNSNIFTGLGISLILSVIILIILRSVSFQYTIFDILLAVVFFAPILDMGILIYAFKPEGFRLNQTIIVLLYNTGIPILFIVISMAYDFISIFI
ncbi:MAG: hypothetical protein JXB88_07200 [Spirochaetales bacterium]|nr:hypothetical protein [Spirochaetales bacterium]